MGNGVLVGKGSCQSTGTKKPAGLLVGRAGEMMMSMPSLCIEATAQFALLLGEFDGIHFAQALKVCELPPDRRHVLEVRAGHQGPVRLAAHEAQEKLPMLGC